jgi:two-component system, sensor histidine kinase and response regulator
MPHQRIQQLIGNNDTDLRQRLLSALCLMMTAAFVAFSIIDFILYTITNPSYWLIDLIFGLACFGLYYLNFYKNKFSTACLVALIIGYLMIISGWYNMGGMGIVVGVCFVVFICYVTFILPQKWYFLFLLSNGIFIMLLVSIELNFPSFIVKNPNITDDLIQQGITVFVVCLVMFTGIYIIKSSHDYEQAKAEEHRKRIENLNKVQSQMISIISHDVRAPMLNMQLMLNMMENNILPKEKIPEMARQIGANMVNSRELLESMISWTRSQVREINDGKRTNTASTQAHLIIQKNLSEWTNNAKRKQITINYNAGCAPETLAIADENLVQTALRNLVLNAIKFTNNDGLIEINTAIHDNRYQITVTDNGMGMPPERTAQLFQTKLNAGKGTTGERGSGIGLWIVHDMLQRTDADIKVESEEGKGSVFTLSFPLKTEV